MVEYSIKFTVACSTDLKPEAPALVATLFTGFVTALGTVSVFFFDTRKRDFDIQLVIILIYI